MGLQTSICSTFAAQHITLPIFQIIIIALGAEFCLLFVSKSSSICSLVNSTESKTTGISTAPEGTRTGSSQSCHTAKLLYSLLLSVSNFYAGILRHEQTLVSLVAKPSHLLHSHSLHCQRFTSQKEKLTAAQAVSCRCKSH